MAEHLGRVLIMLQNIIASKLLQTVRLGKIVKQKLQLARFPVIVASYIAEAAQIGVGMINMNSVG